MPESVKSALRVMQVFELITENPRGLSFSAIQNRMGLPKSSAHALLSTMLSQRFVFLDPDSKTYTAGLRLWEAGQSFVAATNFEKAAAPFMRATCDALNETVQLAILDGTENVYIAKVSADHQLTLASQVGTRLPAYATGIGKALLSGLTDDEIRRRFAGVTFTPFTRHTVSDVTSLIGAVQKVRQEHFSTDHAEHTPGVYCVAMPVRDHTGEVCLGMSVSVPEARMSPEIEDKLRKVLAAQTAALSERLGYRTSGVPLEGVA